MKGNKQETIIVAIAALLLIGIFGTIAYYDRPHGDVGAEFGPGQVDAVIDGSFGHISVPSMPEGLIVFGAGQDASMDFTVTNMDPDNDIDTIFVTIPGSTMTDGSYQWYDLSTHEWSLNLSLGETAVWEADLDYPGAASGGSAMYDVVGNEDDALDADPSNETNEGITLTVEFQVPAAAGFKSGSDAINLEVADLKTEGANEKTPISPFPYPYFVAESGSEFIVMILEAPNCDLQIVYDGTSYFGSTRATGFQTESIGMKYKTDDGRTVVAVTHPGEGKVVKPIVKPLVSDLSGQFSLSVFTFEVTDVSTGNADKTPIVTDYKDDIPSTIGEVVDNDIDGDGTYNVLDDDDDGDGVPDDIDPFPKDGTKFNIPPTGADARVDISTLKEGETFTLTGTATDANNDQLTYTWTVDQIPGWSKVGPEQAIVAEDPFVPGTYVFTLTVSDGIAPETVQDTVTVTIEKKADTSSTPIWIFIVAIAAVVVIIAVLVYFFLVKGKGDEEPVEMGPSDAADDLGGPAPPSQMADEAIEEESMEESYQAPAVSVQAPTAPSPTEGEAEDVQELEQLIEDLEKTEEEIEDLCPECGSPLGPQDTACPSCGAEFELALECPNCGSVVEDNVGSCPSCGIQFV